MYQLPRSGPGPAAYQLPTTIGFQKHDVRRDRKPMYSMTLRTQSKYVTIGPGPAQYRPKLIGSSPKYSLGKRLSQPTPDQIPGPGAHKNELVPLMNFKRPPSYSLSKRLNDAKGDNIPAPNKYEYKLNACKQRGPAWSMRTLTNPAKVEEGPGPNHYPAVDRNLTHNRSPRFSMRETYGMACDKSPRPGPNHYNLMGLQPGASAPRYSFGTRHSMWNPPMIISGDNC